MPHWLKNRADAFQSDLSKNEKIHQFEHTNIFNIGLDTNHYNKSLKHADSTEYGLGKD